MRIVIGLLFCLSTPALADDGGRVSVTITGLSAEGGDVGCALWDQASGFPMKMDRARAQAWAVRSGTVATCAFEGLPAGEYAISVMHDANRSGGIDTNLVGMPQEGWGVTRNPAPRTFRAPRFDEASITVASGTQKQTVQMNY